MSKVNTHSNIYNLTCHKVETLYLLMKSNKFCKKIILTKNIIVDFYNPRKFQPFFHFIIQDNNSGLSYEIVVCFKDIFLTLCNAYINLQILQCPTDTEIDMNYYKFKVNLNGSFEIFFENKNILLINDFTLKHFIENFYYLAFDQYWATSVLKTFYSKKSMLNLFADFIKFFNSDEISKNMSKFNTSIQTCLLNKTLKDKSKIENKIFKSLKIVQNSVSGQLCSELFLGFFIELINSQMAPKRESEIKLFFDKKLIN